MIKASRILIIVIALVLVMPMSAQAFMIKAEQSINIPKDEIVDGNLYVTGASVVVDGLIKGDLICAGQSIIVNGEVEGDVICAGQSLSILGPVGGNVRVIGNSINVNNTVTRNLMAMGTNIILGSASKIGWDALTTGATVDVNGRIDGNWHGGAGNMSLQGIVGKDVLVEVGGRDNVSNKASLILGDQAKVGGNMTYTSSGEADISDKAEIKGEVTRKEYSVGNTDLQNNWQAISLLWFWGKIISIFAALVIGLVLVSLFKDSFKDISKAMMKHPWASLGYGAVMLILTPVIALLLAITIFGFPLSVILMLAWIISVMLSKVIAAIVFGQWLFEKFNWKIKNDIWPMIVGVVVLYLIFSIPVIGWILALLALLWGLGGLWFCCKKYSK